jgi:hypothetical protein
LNSARRRAQVVAAVLAVESAIHLANFGLSHGRVLFLNSGKAWSYSHVLASLAFALCAAAGWAGARRTRRRAWWAVFGLATFLFVDNVSRLHEHIGFWPLIYAPVLAALAIMTLREGRGSDALPALAAGLGILAVSLVIHVVQLPLGRALGLWPGDITRFELWRYQVLIAIKEGTELAGWVLFAPALWALARGQVAVVDTAALQSRPPSVSAVTAGSTSCAPAASWSSGVASSSRSPASAIRRIPTKR